MLLTEATLIKIENVSWKRISIINHNHYWKLILGSNKLQNRTVLAGCVNGPLKVEIMNGSIFNFSAAMNGGLSFVCVRGRRVVIPFADNWI